MKTILLILSVFIIYTGISGCSKNTFSNNTIENETLNERLQTNKMEKDSIIYNELTSEEKRVIINKGTEMPFSGELNNNKTEGTYICKRCNAQLYNSKDKFDSGCGWPSFDDEINGAVKRIPDKDGMRVEIICNNCGGHLGHVFEGERFTEKNTRHCVNSISMKFIPTGEELPKVISNKMESSGSNYQKAIFASGCFWGTEYYMQKAKGVISTTVGYIGGWKENPTYEEVCTGKTGHAEAVEVVFDPSLTSYEELAKLFFETHDPTQINRQGPDIGEQYRTEIFYMDDTQKDISEKLIKILEAKGFKVATKLTKADKFWNAENYHQDYYQNNGKTPYCHIYKKKFD
ncbi:MAG TPA: bifunctional methionine sulfoxide reductase B/A protein [Ignavibacteria bacterium]|nr:bifunctional methionine sulfoxide reductase B/A protein [Ignavibacteria bacterium]